MTNVEIVIIGSGVIGSSIAYHLAKHGRQVLVVECAASVSDTPSCDDSTVGRRLSI
jgi:glycine/D-amino acid oxidase-like deaminating enzyme